MKQVNALGSIDCPTCKTHGGMRITHDKNGDPFGFCEAECGQQLRVGGNARRVALFVKTYPFAGHTKDEPATEPAPVAKPAAAAKPAAQAKPAAKPTPAPAPAPAPAAKPRATVSDARRMLGVTA